MANDKTPQYLEGLNVKDINWRYLASILPEVSNPNPIIGSDKLLHQLAIFRDDDDNADFACFIDALFKHRALPSFFAEKDERGNTPFLWAVSRVICVFNNNLDLVSNNISADLYNSCHPFKFFVTKFYECLSADKDLNHLLYDSNWNNTPLHLALKNGNIELALKLIPHYPLSALLLKTTAGNTALHLASFFRMDSVIEAILKRARELDGLDEVLSCTNRNDYRAFDCYFSDFIDRETYEQLRMNTTKIKWSIQQISTDSQIQSLFENCAPEDLMFFISSDILISFNFDQESAHPYSKLRRNPLNEALRSKLSTDNPPKNLDYSLQTILIQKPKIIFKLVDSKKIEPTVEIMQKICAAFSSEYPSIQIAYITEAYMLNQDYYINAYIDPEINNTPITIYKISPNNKVSVYHKTTEKYFDQDIKLSCSIQITPTPLPKIIKEPTVIVPKNPETHSTPIPVDQNELKPVDSLTVSSSTLETESKLPEKQEKSFEASKHDDSSSEVPDNSPSESSSIEDSQNSEENNLYQAQLKLIMKLYDEQQVSAEHQKQIAIILSIVGILVLPGISHLIIWCIYAALRKDDIVKMPDQQTTDKTYKDWKQIQFEHQNTTYDLYFFNDKVSKTIEAPTLPTLAGG